MKRAALIVACASLLACAGLQKAKVAPLSCEFPATNEIVCYDEGECRQAMQYYGALIADKMAKGLKNKATAVDVNLFAEKTNLSQIGKVWAERRKDGFYVCSHFIYCNLEGVKIFEEEKCNRIGVIYE